MNPRDIISIASGCSQEDADKAIAALAARGFQIVRLATGFPLTISADYKVHTGGELVVMG